MLNYTSTVSLQDFSLHCISTKSQTFLSSAIFLYDFRLIRRSVEDSVALEKKLLKFKKPCS